MMGTTHICIGVASALALTMPENVGGCIAAIVGGAVGGSISDIDVSSKKNGIGSLYAKLIATGIIPLALVFDYIVDGGIIDYIKKCNSTNLTIGIVMFILLCLIGSKQDHRGFTHSLLALSLFSVSIALFCKPIFIPFFIGFASHLLLDTLNKKSIKLFFPLKKGVSLDICYANKSMDKLFLLIGAIGTVVILCYSLFRNISI